MLCTSSVYPLYFLCIGHREDTVWTHSTPMLFPEEPRTKGSFYIGRRIGAEEAGMRAEVSALASRSMRARTLSWMGA